MASLFTVEYEDGERTTNVLGNGFIVYNSREEAIEACYEENDATGNSPEETARVVEYRKVT